MWQRESIAFFLAGGITQISCDFGREKSPEHKGPFMISLHKVVSVEKNLEIEAPHSVHCESLLIENH